MMRSDMPKQVMAYRNGGGIPSLATVPMSTEIRGEPHQLSYITPFEAEMLRGMGGSGAPGPGGIPQYAGVYETLFGKPFSQTAVGRALGMNNPPPGHPEYNTTASLPSTNQAVQITTSERSNSGGNNSSGNNLSPSGTQIFADGSYFDPATNTYIKPDGTFTSPNPNSGGGNLEYFTDENLVSLGNSFKYGDDATNQTLINNMSDKGVLDNFIAVNTAAGNDLSYIDNLNEITSVSTPGVTSVSTPGVTSVSTPGVTSVASPTNFTNDSIAAVPDFTGYAPIVPSVASADGIMGLDSGQGSPFVYTAYMPEAYTPATGSLVLPPLG